MLKLVQWDAALICSSVEHQRRSADGCCLFVLVACTFASCSWHQQSSAMPCEVICLLQKESSPGAYASWYPPVQQTLLCLSKLYRCVEARVFAGLAQDAVSSCTKAVQVRLPSFIRSPQSISPCYPRTWPLKSKYNVTLCCAMLARQWQGHKDPAPRARANT